MLWIFGVLKDPLDPVYTAAQGTSKAELRQQIRAQTGISKDKMNSLYIKTLET